MKRGNGVNSREIPINQMMLLELLDNLPTRRVASAAAFRNVAIGANGYRLVNPLLVDSGERARQDFEKIAQEVETAVKQGRMIDFGYVPNAIIKAESTRSRDAFEASELPYPYEDGWVGTMAWEGGYNGYYVMPAAGPGEWVVVELYGTKSPNGVDILLFYDAVGIRAAPGNTQLSPYPMPHRLNPFEELQSERMRASNSLDPLVTMLRLLADASIPVSRFEPPEKLNKAHAKAGKPLIPSHSIVHTHDYVSQITAHASRRTAGDGTGHHASPVAHWRRSHQRHLSGGRVVQVRSSKVNWRDHEEIHRLFSRVGEPKSMT
jgi:hypothetical protein